MGSALPQTKHIQMLLTSIQLAVLHGEAPINAHDCLDTRYVPRVSTFVLFILILFVIVKCRSHLDLFRTIFVEAHSKNGRVVFTTVWLYQFHL